MLYCGGIARPRPEGGGDETLCQAPFSAGGWLGIAVAACLAAMPATAAQVGPCGKRADILRELTANYGEVPVAAGLNDQGNLVELLISADGATWTVMISSPAGVSCLAASGENWTPVERQGTKMGDPT